MDSAEALINASKGNLKPPKCAVEGCDNKAFILLQGSFVCGDCCKRFQDYKQKIMSEILFNMNNKTGVVVDKQ